MKALRALALALLCLCSAARAAAADDLQRVAIVVGANKAPPGRSPLRYAHEDARRVSEVLVAVAGFLPQNIKVLLDPEPGALLAALDQELANAGKRQGETLLFFYYSGHADERAIFPRGQTLEFRDLKSRLEDPRAKLRVGLLDSCRGGSWTGSKGLKKVEPFEVDAMRELAEEGSVLIASSSGLENAHETEALRGSFFTHYWNAGLRGAADRGGDGVVTLGEAFEYARSLTIRDTALAGQTPQHPSFQMKLAGRRDFPLATLAKERTTLLFEQTTGPIELVRLSDGLVVVESTPGAQRLRLRLSAGSYLVRRRSPEGVWGRVVSLSSGGSVALNESQLEFTRLRSSSSKDVDSSSSPHTTWNEQWLYASVALGVRHAPIIDPGLRVGAADGEGVFLMRLSTRLARRWWLAAPLSLVFDAERPARLAWFAWAGAPVLGATVESGNGFSLRGFTGAGLDLRLRQSEKHTFNATLAALGTFAWTQNGAFCSLRASDGACLAERNDRRAPTTWTTQLSLGLSETVPGSVSFNIGVAAGLSPLIDGKLSDAPLDSSARNVTLAIGSVQRIGLRPLPLIHLLLSEAWAIDGHVAVAYVPSLEGWVETYTGGVSYER